MISDVSENILFPKESKTCLFLEEIRHSYSQGNKLIKWDDKVIWRRNKMNFCYK